MRSAASVRVITALAILLLAGSLAGCVDPGSAPTLPTQAPATPGGSAPEPTIDPTPEAIPLDVACADLVSPQVAYDLNPNLALLGSWTPAAGTAPADALAGAGVACRWVMESGGAGMDVSAARVDAAQRAERESAAAAGRSVPGWGDAAYFAESGGVGTVTVFTEDVWLVVSSILFAQAADARAVVESALTAISGA